MADIKEYPSRDELEVALAARVEQVLSEAVRDRGQGVLVVSGGRTPVALFERLAELALDWRHITITLADERWVSPNHADSNEQLVRKHLLCGAAAKARFVPLYDPKAATVEAGADEAELLLSLLPDPFDVLLLGMGGDGHTASLFPGAERLQHALAPNPMRDCCWQKPPEYASHQRITLTLPRLLRSRLICLHLNGDDKHAVLTRAMADDGVDAMPVRGVLKQEKVPVEIYWAS
ncbi:MAG: 6-phosphogluconolactonase [Oceanospirillaceae bacterium]|nr:6-phosphogluconolactonase [Oceanospirillaceae bacterium]